MSIATTRQIAGNHYLKMGIQPIEFAMANGWDAGAFSILKYLSRHESKNGLQDVQKAKHFVELREQFIDHVVVTDDRITLHDYVVRNGFTGFTHTALYHLNEWVRVPSSNYHRDLLLSCLDKLIAEYEGGQKSLAFDKKST